jgi:argininosuccinate lyase
VGEILALAAEKALTPESLPLDVLHRYSPAFEEDVRDVWSYKRSVERKTCSGGVAAPALDVQLERARDRLNGIL